MTNSRNFKNNTKVSSGKADSIYRQTKTKDKKMKNQIDPKIIEKAREEIAERVGVDVKFVAYHDVWDWFEDWSRVDIMFNNLDPNSETFKSTFNWLYI